MSNVRMVALAVAVSATAGSGVGCGLERREESRCTVEHPECPGDLVCDGERCVARSAPPPDRGLTDRGLTDRGLPDRGAPDRGPADRGLADHSAPDLPRPDARQPDRGPADGPLPERAAPDLAPPDVGPADAPAPDTGCTPGTTGACYTGPPGTLGVGSCVAGQASCEASGSWGPCFGQVTPMSDTCDGKDNDCDGTADPGCSCVAGATRPCGTDVGQCTTGIETCQANGTWGPCSGVGPTAEQCDSLDHDCDGAPYNGLECVAGTVDNACKFASACGGTLAGTRLCSRTTCTWGPCNPPSSYCDKKGCVSYNNCTSKCPSSTQWADCNTLTCTWQCRCTACP